MNTSISSPSSSQRSNVNYDQTYLPTSYIQSNLKQFIDKADLFASEFFNQNTGESKTVHHYHSYSPFYSPWAYYGPFWHQPVVVVGNRRTDDESSRIFLAILTGVGALMASYAIGSAWSRLSEANDELENTKAFEKSIEGWKEHCDPREFFLIEETSKIAGLKEKMCRRITNSASWDLVLRVAVAAGLVLTTAGLAIPHAPALAVGLSFTITSLAAVLFKWGFDSNDRANVRDAVELKAALEGLKKL